jgi:hypothetical protein
MIHGHRLATIAFFNSLLKPRQLLTSEESEEGHTLPSRCPLADVWSRGNSRSNPHES